MRKALAVLFAIMFVVTMTAPLYAASGGEKFSGGIKKIVKSPLQVVNNVEDEYEAAGFKPFGVVGGTFKGLFHMGGDIVTGMFDVLTFPIDFDK